MFISMNSFSRILFTIICAALLFTSCLNYEQITTLKTDGSGEMYIHFWTSLKSKQDSAIILASGLFDENSFRKKFNSKIIDLIELETYHNPNDSTIHSKVKYSFNDVNSLSSLEIFEGVEFTFYKNEDDDIEFSQIFRPIASSYGFSNKTSNFSYTYYLPGKILEHNANIKSNNKLIWEFTYNDSSAIPEKLFARFTPYKLKETPSWVYYSSLFIILVVLYYLFKKRRS
jgi:hypothetical protein